MVTKRPKQSFTNLEVMTFGLCQVIDGLVRIISLGYLFTSLPLICSRKQTERIILKRKREIDEKRNNNQEQ
jgi:hypothetical protein